MTLFLLLVTFLLLFSSANANHEDNVLNDPNLEIVVSPWNESSKQVGKEAENSKRKAIQDSEEKELNDFIGRWMDYNNRNVGRANRKGKAYTWKEIQEKERLGKGALNKTALLKKQKEDLVRVEETGDKSIAQPKTVESKENNTGDDLNHTKSDAKKNVDQIIDHSLLRGQLKEYCIIWAFFPNGRPPPSPFGNFDIFTKIYWSLCVI